MSTETFTPTDACDYALMKLAGDAVGHSTKLGKEIYKLRKPLADRLVGTKFAKYHYIVNPHDDLVTYVSVTENGKGGLSARKIRTRGKRVRKEVNGEIGTGFAYSVATPMDCEVCGKVMDNRHANYQRRMQAEADRKALELAEAQANSQPEESKHVREAALTALYDRG